MTDLPVLYSFRRCPYAIRARMAIAYADLTVELREIVLRNKPAAMLAASPKATVPVLCLPQGAVLEESLDIMRWALGQSDPDGWLAGHVSQDAAHEQSPDLAEELAGLLANNDGDFKHWLDRYKYADRFPEHPAAWYREQAEQSLKTLETRLEQSP